MMQTPIKTLTLEEFLELPETKPASEYIDGDVIQKPMPKGKHSRIQTKLAATLNSVLENNQTAQALTELRCTFGERSIVPDIAVFTWNRIPVDQSGEIADIFLIAPDWCIEILSPEQSQTKVISKMLHAFEHGTELAWVIDPEEKSVLVLSANQPVKMFTEPSEILTVPNFAVRFQFTVGDLFRVLTF